MREDHDDDGTKDFDCASTLPDSFVEISNERGRFIIKADSKIMEFIHESGAGFTLYEESGDEYVGCLITSDRNSRYYKLDPDNVVTKEIELADLGYRFPEHAMLPLRNNGWQLTYYNEEHAKEQMYELFNGDGISISSSQG